jgi:glucose/arabinose dehydrogenase
MIQGMPMAPRPGMPDVQVPGGGTIAPRVATEPDPPIEDSGSSTPDPATPSAPSSTTPTPTPTPLPAAPTPHAPGFLKGLGMGLTATGGLLALASIPASAVHGGSRSAMLFGGLGAAVAGIGLLTTWRMKQDKLDHQAHIQNLPGELPGGGTSVSDAHIPDTVSGVSGAIHGVQAPANPPKIELKTVAKDLGQLTQVTHAQGDDGLWLVEKTGKLLHRDPDGKVETRLDISSIVDGNGERGLLSVAFHPDYAQNGRLFVNDSDQEGNNHVAEAHADADGKVERSSLKDLMVIDHPGPGNHNGGQLQFGPDGMLYIGTGDGGGEEDVPRNAQNVQLQLGKLLRIDVDHQDPGKTHAIPADNPFKDTPGAQPEIYTTGVRNPWRFSFDSKDGDLWIGDVGQNKWEEVDYVPRGQGLGANFGWNVREAGHPYKDGTSAPGTRIDPALEYSHDEGASITGGYVYHGDAIPALQGYYVYSDISNDKLRAMKVEDGKVVDREEMPAGSGRDYTVSYGEGPDGEMYAVTLSGELTKVVKAGSAGGVDNPSGPTGEGTVVPIGVKDDQMRFDQTEYHVKAGTVTLRLHNTDSSHLPHNIGVQGNGINKMSPMSQHGQTVSVTADLEPGEYTLYCAPHMGMGMTAKLIVDPA